MNPKEKLLALQKACAEMVAGAKAQGRDLTNDEISELEAKSAEALELKGKIDRAEKSAQLFGSIAGMQSDVDPTVAGFGGQVAAGTKGHLALAGASGRLAAKQIAEQIRRTFGQKAFLAPGAVTSSVPLLPQGPIELGRTPTSVLDVLRTTVHDSPVWRYLRQTAIDNQAAIVAPGATKPTTPITVESVDGALQVFAHLSEYVDEFLLADNDALARFIGQQLLYGLQQAVEEEVLNGDGTAGHLTGLVNTSGIQTQAFVDDRITTLRTAALKLENMGYSSDVFVVNIADWAAIETARASSGSFDLGGPIDRAEQKAWGTQVVTSSRLAAGTALALDLDAAGFDVDTQGVTVKWDTSTGFDKNQVRARVEGRFGVSVYSPAGIVKATLTAA